MSLIAREAEQSAKRRALSIERYGHPGAHVSEYPGIDWREEALALEAQLAGAVDALVKIANGAELRLGFVAQRQIATEALEAMGVDPASYRGQ